MFNVRQFVINEYRHKILFSYCNEQSLLACNLYNASLFRIRQIFTGWDKPNRSDNENQVFGEVALLESTYPSIKVKQIISYTHLEKLMRVTANPDFFAGLPMQTAQAIVKAACQDFKNWLTSLKDFKASTIFKNIENKLNNNEKITEEDIASLQVIVYTGYDESQYEVLIEARLLLEKISKKSHLDINEKKAIIYLFDVLSANMLNDDERDKYGEEVYMLLNPMDRFLENKGRKEGLKMVGEKVSLMMLEICLKRVFLLRR